MIEGFKWLTFTVRLAVVGDSFDQEPFLACIDLSLSELPLSVEFCRIRGNGGVGKESKAQLLLLLLLLVRLWEEEEDVDEDEDRER